MEKIDKPKNIVFGRLSDNAIGQVRSLGEAGMCPIVVWIGDEPKILKASKFTNEIYVFNSTDESIAWMIDKYKNESIKPVITTDTDLLVSALDSNYNRLKDYFYFFNAGEQGRLSKYMAKETLCCLANHCGLKTPKSEVLKVGELPQSIKYPVITKSINSFKPGWKQNVHICYTEDDLKDAYKTIEGDEILVQEYIEKKNEYILQGISINAGNSVYIPIKGMYYRLPPDAYGTYLYFQKHTWGSIADSLKKMFMEIGYSGVFEAEFLVDNNGNLYFLEINFRHTLWNHTFTKMGINLCKIWSDSISAGELKIDGAYIKKEPYTLISEFSDFQNFVKTHKITFFKWLYDTLTADSHVNYDSHDCKPYFVILKNYLKRVCL